MLPSYTPSPPERKPIDPRVFPLSAAVIALGLFIFIMMVALTAYCVRRKYFPNEARVLKLLNNKALKPAVLERILYRLKPQEYSQDINKYN
jgi:hypothetical protein